MGQALYRKYRSKSLKEIIGQDHITQTLNQAIKSGRISHAYLLTGPRGVGKTSVARILAHEINNLPYTDDSSHIDIIEIDAASNRRIDEIRELRERVYVAPTSSKYKVYIIDEVHMLTKEAFNALLKTLEEPPAHVVFILATTDAHKLPETIVSRTQRFTFKPVSKQEVVKHLKHIAKEEKIDVSDEALELLAEHGEGSFRDSISLFDQASNQSTKIEANNVRQLLGIPPANLVARIIFELSSGANLSSVVTTLSDLYNQGYQASAIAKQLSQILRQSLLDNQLILPSDQLLLLLGQLIAVPAAHDPERFLEITLLSNSRPSLLPIVKVIKAQPEELSKPEFKTPKNEILKAETAIGVKPKARETPDPKPDKTEKLEPGNSSYNITLWPTVLDTLKKRYNTLYGVIRMAQPNFTDNNNLELSFAFAFHQKRINETKNQQIMSDIIYELTGKNVKVNCIVDKNVKPLREQPAVKPEAVDKKSDDISAISNIFGGAELIES